MTGLTIGQVARRTGLTAKTIRFYEEEGLLPPARRSEGGYRLYSEADLMRLRLVQRLRLLDLGLPAVKALVEQAFAADCSLFGEQLMDSVSHQRAEVDRRLHELHALEAELRTLEEHLKHCCEGCSPADMASQCDFCGLITDEERR